MALPCSSFLEHLAGSQINIKKDEEDDQSETRRLPKMEKFKGEEKGEKQKCKRYDWVSG